MGPQDVVNTIVNTITDFMHGDASPSQGGQGLQAKLEAVADACETAIQRDETEAKARWLAASLLGPVTSAFTAARVAFDGKAGSLTAQLRLHVVKLRESINTDITPHLDSPAKLSADAKYWVELGSRVSVVRDQVKVLGKFSGWDDKASPEYFKATEVQADALTELGRIMGEVGGSCQQGALTNSAGFIEVQGLLGDAASKVLGLGSSGGNFYSRTAGAIMLLAMVRHRVRPPALSAYEMGMKIDQNVDKAMASTDLVPLTWPSGTSGAGIAAPSTSG